MVELPSDEIASELKAIHGELASILARYRRIAPHSGHICQIGDVLRMHEDVWDAVALLREMLPLPASQAALLAHLYQSRRDPLTGAVTLSGLAEMIELLGRLLAPRRLH
jgi:hypothetical protein